MSDATPLPRILLVDDEPRLLKALSRQLRREFTIETAGGSAEGLRLLRHRGPFSVIVSDFSMPGTNGDEFLAKTRDIAPDVVRVLLTGHASLQEAAATVNRGQVYRLLLKPIDGDDLKHALLGAVEQFQLITAERELLEQTLQGSVKVLADVLALINPVMFARMTRTRRVVTSVLDVAEPQLRWPIDLAAMLSQLGAVSLPKEVSERLEAGRTLRPNEQAMVDALPEIAVQLLCAVPRLAPVCDAIRYSRKWYNGTGRPADGVAGDDIPLGGRVLCLAEDFDELTTRGASDTEALTALNARRERYDPDLLKALAVAVSEWDSAYVQQVAMVELEPGMLFTAEVRARSGTVLVPRGQEVTRSVIARLRNFSATHGGVAEPLSVLTLRPPGE